jgi:hypothetical protein
MWGVFRYLDHLSSRTLLVDSLHFCCFYFSGTEVNFLYWADMMVSQKGWKD